MPKPHGAGVPFADTVVAQALREVAALGSGWGLAPPSWPRFRI